jgi:hypothetical protein
LEVGAQKKLVQVVQQLDVHAVELPSQQLQNVELIFQQIIQQIHINIVIPQHVRLLLTGDVEPVKLVVLEFFVVPVVLFVLRQNALQMLQSVNILNILSKVKNSLFIIIG